MHRRRGGIVRLRVGSTPPISDSGHDIAALKARIADLEQRTTAPELGQQMLELQIRHDRLRWAGDAGNWNLAYYMVSELGEALRGIEETNGEAPELQPQKLSEVMPAIMNPAIRSVQEALAKKAEAARSRMRTTGCRLPATLAMRLRASGSCTSSARRRRCWTTSVTRPAQRR